MVSEMSYSAKLKDPRWQRRRLEIMSRDDWTCQACGEKEATLHVHHKEYGGEPWEVADDKLVTLCEGCHEKAGNGFAIYMAGKIAKGDWRHGIVSGLRGHLPAELCIDTPVDEAPAIIPKAVMGLFGYCGPFFVSCDHGCFHQPHTHACSDGECGNVDMDDDRADVVSTFAMQAIERAGLVIVWLEPETCLSAYGTIAEIGAARALNKPLVIGTSAPSLPRDIWFPLALAPILRYNLSGPAELVRLGVNVANHI